MAEEAEETPLDIEEEEEGGPVKPFLEHLEDLRWMLLKSIAAVGIAMVVCLIAGNKLVAALSLPIQKTRITVPDPAPRVAVYFGTNRLGNFVLTEEERSAFGLATNSGAALQLQPMMVGDHLVLALQPATNAPAAPPGRHLVDLINLSPTEGFIVAIKLAIYGGIILSLPFLLYFIGEFVFPALKKNERRFALRGLGIGTLLFMGGVAFCYFVVLPIVLGAAVKYSQWLGFEANQWRATDYIGFAVKFMLGMGIGFELPVVVLTLVKIGVVSYEGLVRMRVFMLVGIMVLSAMLTPPDVISQLLMTVPMYLLYEVSVFIARYWARRDARERAQY